MTDKWLVQLSPRAQKQLKQLPADIRNRIIKKLELLIDDPRPSGVVKMQGSLDRWRIRIGDYRVIYQLIDDKHIVIVLVVAHRRSAYR